MGAGICPPASMLVVVGTPVTLKNVNWVVVPET
jgi:hypothetical protein